MRPTARASGQTLASTAAIVVAAGRGSRLGAGRPKAFVALAGRPMVAWSLDAIAAAGVPRAVVAVPPGHGAAAEEALADAAAAFPLGFALVEGGATRSASVRNALAAAPEATIAVVHDAARPLVTRELVERCLAALEPGIDGAIAAVPMTDTVKEAAPDGRVMRTLDRSALWAIQTPQVFKADVLRAALERDAAALAAATDDAALVEDAGGVVTVVESFPENLKVTRASDLRIAEALLAD
jgi:2-C-methyl-D-erythritol 4-phosphate cytidylyltransferase